MPLDVYGFFISVSIQYNIFLDASTSASKKTYTTIFKTFNHFNL
jgi:hypothetical protein